MNSRDAFVPSAARSVISQFSTSLGLKNVAGRFDRGHRPLRIHIGGISAPCRSRTSPADLSLPIRCTCVRTCSRREEAQDGRKNIVRVSDTLGTAAPRSEQTGGPISGCVCRRISDSIGYFILKHRRRRRRPRRHRRRRRRRRCVVERDIEKPAGRK